jgi:nucleoside 2-deoxyribosyltransferase
MNIYFSCSITGGRQDQAVYAEIVDHLLAKGFEVPTAHLSSAGILDEETMIEAEAVYQRDTRWVEGCDALIAEVSTPSHGVGYEIALAVTLGKPVLCCYQRGRKVSKMILGNTHEKLRLTEYTESADLILSINEFLKDFFKLRQMS